MNLEMPSPAEADSLRTILLIVLGVLILTIPVVCVIVVAKVTAQRKQRPAPDKGGDRASQDAGAMDPMMMGLMMPSSVSDSTRNEPVAHHSDTPLHRHGDETHPTPDDSPAGDHTSSAVGGETGWSDSGTSFSDGGDSGGVGDSGKGGSSGDSP